MVKKEVKKCNSGGHRKGIKTTVHLISMRYPKIIIPLIWEGYHYIKKFHFCKVVCTEQDGQIFEMSTFFFMKFVFSAPVLFA